MSRARTLAPVFHELTLFHGSMGAGKSTLALQNAYNRRQAGRPGFQVSGMVRGGGGVLWGGGGGGGGAIGGSAGSERWGR
ncbi:hypothetical protein AB0C31_38070, partial [Actinoplanes philippinensis]